MNYPRMNRTPSIVNPLPLKHERTGQELIDWLEDRYSDYRHDCDYGYCTFDKSIADKFEADIAEARKNVT